MPRDPKSLFEEFGDASDAQHLPERQPDIHPDLSHVEVPTLSRDFNMGKVGMRNKSPPHTGIVTLINELAYRHSPWQVFSDFCEVSALSLSNAVDLAQSEKREARYREIIKRYTPEELKRFPEMLAALTNALEDETSDVLGKAFHELELHNKWAGQFFTPYDLCRMMAKMTLGDEAQVRELIECNGFVRVAEPAVGSGAMVIALAQEMRAMGINYQRHLHVTAVDVDAKCVHMAYAQFSLLHVPAVIVHGNSLSLEEYGHWYTPAHILDGWRWKLKRAAENDLQPHAVATVPGPQPTTHTQPADSNADDPPAAQLTLF